MSKRYTKEEILEMSVNKLTPDPAADMDGDGKITPEDARLAPETAEVPDAGKGDLEISRAVLDRILSAPEYRYDREEDPLYRQYRDSYERMGSRAAQNAFGLASANTGGYASSYASTVAADAYDYYMRQLEAKGESLEQKAYDRAADERQDLYRQLEAVGKWEDRLYGRERDEKSDEYRDREYGRNLAKDTLDFAFDAAKNGDYSFLAALGVDVSRLQAEDRKDDAAFGAKYGDLSGLAALGIDVSSLLDEQDRNRAAFYAKYGDLSGLAALGVDVSSLLDEQNRDRAAFYAKFGDLSGLSAMGVDVSQLRKDQLYQVAALFAKYGDYSLLQLLI